MKLFFTLLFAFAAFAFTTPDSETVKSENDDLLLLSSIEYEGSLYEQFQMSNGNYWLSITTDGETVAWESPVMADCSNPCRVEVTPCPWGGQLVSTWAWFYGGISHPANGCNWPCGTVNECDVW